MVYKFLSLLLFLLCFVFEPIAALADNATAVESIRTCNQIAQEIQKKLSGSRSVDDCNSSFELYKQHLKNCLHTSNEMHEYTQDNIPELADKISECYQKNKKPQAAKEVYSFSLQSPNWETIGPTSCHGTLIWQEALEYLDFQEQKIQRCILSKEKLMELLEQFKKTKDMSLLKSIRGKGFFANEGLEGGCKLPFAIFEEQFGKALIKAKSITIIPIRNQHEDLNENSDDVITIAIEGFVDNKIWVLYFEKSKSENCYFFTGFTHFDDKEQLQSIYKI